jgi:E1A/CREB-binding protein
MIDQAPTNYILSAQQQQPQQTQSNHMLVQQPTQQPTNTSQQHTEVQRKQFIQKQLVLLLHAHKCQQREKQTINGEITRPNTCTLPHCNTMKSVLQHMTKCNDHKTCTVPHCVTSRQIILHWKQCNNPQCPICQPLKTPSTLAKLNQTAATNSSGVSSTNLASTLTLNSMNERVLTKDWQRRVTSEMRNHLVQKIITALIPITDTGAVRDKRIINLANYARRVESETFEVANNQEEYFHKLAEKIYKIQKELEDRREKKRLQDMQLAAQISSTTGQTSSTNDYNGKIHSTMDTMAGDHGPPNRTAPLTDYASSVATTGNVLHQPLTTVTNSNRTLLNGTTNTSTGTFTITNVPPNENLNFLLNGDTATTNQQHDIDMTDATIQIKNELLSPKTSFQSSTFSMIKKEPIINTDLLHSTVMIKSSESTMNDDTKPKLPQIDSTSKQLPKYPVQFTPEELRTRLEPVLHKMIACEDSHPFRQPVDPVALNILDYPTIIKHPMDISTMHNKLLQGAYKNPLQFCDDAWLMFNNAWLYNKKTTRVYKMCSKVNILILFELNSQN